MSKSSETIKTGDVTSGKRDIDANEFWFFAFFYALYML